MVKTISIKILKVQYGGDSIGDNVRIEIKISGQLFTLDQTIKPGTTFEFNQEIRRLQIDNNILEVPIHIKVIEKDLIPLL